MTLDIDLIVAIDRPTSSVFEYWSNLETSESWTLAALERESIGDRPVGMGARYRAVDSWYGRSYEYTMEVTEFKPNELLAVEMTGAIEGGWRASFEDVGGVTRVHYSLVANIPRTLRDPLIRLTARREISADVGHLKRLVEVEGDLALLPDAQGVKRRCPHCKGWRRHRPECPKRGR